jgi:hypothetical protein
VAGSFTGVDARRVHTGTTAVTVSNPGGPTEEDSGPAGDQLASTTRPSSTGLASSAWFGSTRAVTPSDPACGSETSAA